jgi:anaerobic magnesium-protoporphyrin IX monomethyl ester cyclase
LKHYGISTSGTYILGLDKDTKESIKNDLERLNKLLINILIFIIFTPYPELPLYPKWKKDGKIIHDNWKEYDGLHMVFKHPFLSPEEAKETLNYAVCNVYSPYNYNKRRVLRRLDQLKREKESLKVQTREVLTIKN